MQVHATSPPPSGPPSPPGRATIRILIADQLAPEGARFLESQRGVEVSTRTGLSGDALAEALAHHDGVVIRSAVQVTGPVLEACMRRPGARLRAVARAGVGVDNIDVETATRRGIVVMNSASASTITTAEHAFALMIALARNVGFSYLAMTRGGWDRNRFVGAQLHGRTLGVVGMGRIGQTLARRALDFGMKVLGHDPFINAPALLEGRVPLLQSFDELIGQVDIVSFHVPLTEATTGMMGSRQFARARAGLLVVNAARGGVIDETALLEALASGRCGGAAIDVFEAEPLPKDSPLRSHPRILTTPHLGASTVEAQEAVSIDACRALLAYLRGEGLSGAVNVGGLQLDLTPRQQGFVDLARRMVSLLMATIGTPGLAAVQVTVRGEALGGRADTIGRLALAELLGHHLDQPVNVVNATLIAEERSIRHDTIIARESGEDRLAITVFEHDKEHRVEGAIYEDGLPRITHLAGYALDMVPSGHMVLLTNDDKPGRIGVVGKTFGDANVNIAEMVIGRRRQDTGRHQVAMMVIKLDEAPPASVLDALRRESGILSLASVRLPD